MNELSEHDRIYLAAVIEHAGSINIHKSKQTGGSNAPSFQAVIIICSELNVLDDLKRLIGTGSAYKRSKRNGVLHIYHSDTNKLLKMVYPHMRYKRAQADIIFEFVETFDGFTGSAGVSIETIEKRQELMDRLKALHHS